MDVGKNIKMKKRERGRGSNNIFTMILRLFGRISNGEKGKVTEIFWEENQD